MVVLDAVHDIQATQAHDLACRWNCKAGKCGSCSAEVNGMPKLMCMTRMSDLAAGKTGDDRADESFSAHQGFGHRRLLEFSGEEKNQAVQAAPPDAPDGTWRMQQEDIDRVQEFRKCIECFLCQDVCHVLRDHQMHDKFIGPRFLIYVAALEMHPLDTEDRIEELRNAQGIGYCNITKCCTKVCPESIEITDNGIIPLKERVVDEFYDPLGWFWSWLKKKSDSSETVNRESLNRVCFQRFNDLTNHGAMSELKPLHKDAIPAALEKAERYRLLNEPGEAESICLDILAVDPDNQRAIITLLLAFTDRFEKGYGVSETQTKELLGRVKSEYERAYYSGISPNAGQRRNCGSTRRAAGFRLTIFCAKQWTGSKKPNRSAHPVTTMRFCGGTPAPASSSETNS